MAIRNSAPALGNPLLNCETPPNSQSVVLLGLEAEDGHVTQDPILPETISRLAIRDLSGPAGLFDAEADRTDAPRPIPWKHVDWSPIAAS